MTQLDKNALALQSAVSTKLPLLRRIAYRRLGNASDAEDAVQDALLLAHRDLAQFRGDSSLVTWIGSILINSINMHRRRHCSRLALASIALDDLAVEIRDPQPNAEERCRAGFEQRQMRVEVSRLP